MLEIKTHSSLQKSWPVQWPWEGHALCVEEQIWWLDLHGEGGG